MVKIINLKQKLNLANSRTFNFSSTVDNDPHFVVQVSGIALPLCFDIHGEDGDVFSLIRDDKSGQLRLTLSKIFYIYQTGR